MLIKLILYEDPRNGGCLSGLALITDLNQSPPAPTGNTRGGTQPHANHNPPTQL